MNRLAPISLFVFNRPQHTLQTLEALSKNHLADQSLLYIFADGPKANASNYELEQIAATRNIIRKENWCKEVQIIESPKNKGLANSIIEGVSQVIDKHGKVIVLEDDIRPSKGFLQYMNNALDTYEHEDKVGQISAYNYPLDIQSSQDTYFLNILSCWGWATWKRAWQYYNHNIQDHLNTFADKRSIQKFNIEGHADFYNQLLMNRDGKIYSWAVRWYASLLTKGMFTLFPKQSLVVNTGHDGTGVHSGSSNIFGDKAIDFIHVEKQPLVENVTARKQVDKFYKTTFRKWIKSITPKQTFIKRIRRGHLYKALAKLYKEVKKARYKYS
jgi:hypothetical protein